jgi:DNA-binding transcriptional LysR family regulator
LLDSAVMQVTQGSAALADWRDAPSGSLRINTFGYAARTILAPRLPKFLLDYPDVSVEVIVKDRNIDLVAGGFDAGIRLSEAVERGHGGRAGCPPHLRTVVVGTPEYFSRHPRPDTPGHTRRLGPSYLCELSFAGGRWPAALKVRSGRS